MSAMPVSDSFNSEFRSRDTSIMWFAELCNLFIVTRNSQNATGPSANDTRVICQLIPNR